MTRTVKYGIQFTLMFIFGLVGLIAIGIGLAYLLPQSTGLLLVLGGISLFLPGRLLAHYWKDYFEGQKLQVRRKHLDALVHFERFLRLLRERPALKKFIWLTEWIYTRNAEVLALTNMGVCYLRLNNLDEAEQRLLEAARLDPLSPLPHYNLSVAYHALGDKDRAEEHLNKAAALGYRAASIKGLAKAAQEVYASNDTAS
jgi:tetratricopeptide (TPR) repeat protein